MAADCLSQAWWPTATVEPLDALREVCSALEQGRVASPEAARHVARGLRQYLDGDRDLTRNLGLRVSRGGRHRTAEAREKKQRRDGLIREAVALAPGHTASDRAALLATAIAAPAADIDGGQLDAMHAIVARLKVEFAGDLPASARQVARIASSA